jgi:hypothetical protein
MEVIPESNSLNKSLLEDAWRLFSIYDRSAIETQKRFLHFRVSILCLVVVATVLVVVKSQWWGDVDLKKADINQILTSKEGFLYFLVIMSPIVVSVLLAASVKFDRGMNWILLRASAETVKKEIYCYRTMGVYERQDSDMRLAQAIQIVADRLMKTQVNRSGLALDKRLEIGSKQFLEAIQASTSSKDSNPLSALTTEQYLEYRLIDQLSWYRRKTLKIDRQWQLLQWSIYVLGGLGAFLAATHAEIWIAITNAIATALASFLDLKQLDTTLMSYNQAACNLENLLCWWHALTDDARKERENIEKLVLNTERVIQAETTSWVQEMRDALSELYKEDKKMTELGGLESRENKSDKVG